MATSKMFVHYSGTKAAFIAAGLPSQYTNKIVFIKDGENGTGACVYTHGNYYANVEEAIAALKFFSKISANGVTAEAAGNNGTVNFTADDPVSVSVKVDQTGVHFGLADEFKAAVNTLLPNRIEAADAKGAQGIADAAAALGVATTAKNAVKTLEGLANSTEAMETLAGQVVQIEENKMDIFYLKGADDKEIVDTITWTKGAWSFTNNSGGGSSYMQNTFRYSNKIDISIYDSAILSGLANGSSMSNAENRHPTISIFGDGEPIAQQQVSDGNTFVIYRSDYAQYNKLEIIILAYRSEETYIPSVKVSAEGNAVLKEEFGQLKEKVNSNELAISNLVGNEFDLSQSLQWEGGFINIDGTITVSGANATVYRHTYVDVRNYDIVAYSGLIPGNNQTTNNRAINVIADGVIVKNIPAASGEIICSEYEFNESLVLAISARTDTEVTIVGVVTRKIPTQEEFNELKEQVSTNENGIEALKTTIEGVKGKEIADTIVWTKGVWNYTNNSGGGSPFMKETYRYSNKIDISNYDEVVLSGLWRGSSASTNDNRMGTVTFFGDGEPIDWKDASATGAIINIYRADYAQYNKLEIVVNALQSEETYIPSVKVTKKGIAEGGEAVAKRIVLCGDSLTGNDSALLTYEFKSIAKSQGYEIVRNSMGGENIIGNLTRNGGIAMRTTTEFTIPASGSAVVELGSAWMKSTGEYAALPSSITSVSVVINNVEGVITRNTDGTYTFARKEEGQAIKVGAGVIFWDKTLWTCRDYPHVWFTGQNGGYENEADWADMINSAARNFGENFIVCSTALERTTNELVRQATKTFGDKYINLRAYTQGQAVYDGQRYGLIDSSYTAADYEALFWPGSDKIHNNNLLAYIWAVLMWNTLLDLGYVEGERIDTGEYYLE